MGVHRSQEPKPEEPTGAKDERPTDLLGELDVCVHELASNAMTARALLESGERPRRPRTGHRRLQRHLDRCRLRQVDMSAGLDYGLLGLFVGLADTLRSAAHEVARMPVQGDRCHG
jgi:hypothetical protein